MSHIHWGMKYTNPNCLVSNRNQGRNQHSLLSLYRTHSLVNICRRDCWLRSSLFCIRCKNLWSRLRSSRRSECTCPKTRMSTFPVPPCSPCMRELCQSLKSSILSKSRKSFRTGFGGKECTFLWTWYTHQYTSHMCFRPCRYNFIGTFSNAARQKSMRANTTGETRLPLLSESTARAVWSSFNFVIWIFIYNLIINFILLADLKNLQVIFCLNAQN
jgi:hypothetical protein